MPDIDAWANSVQAAVTAIRKAGATSQIILLPGDDYTSVSNSVSSGSAVALANVTNLDGSIRDLVFDVHQYLDSDGSGTHVSCVSNHIEDAFSPLATWLRQNARVALLSETGGGSDDPSCLIGMFIIASWPSTQPPLLTCPKNSNSHPRHLPSPHLPESKLRRLPWLCRLGCRLIRLHLHLLPLPERLRRNRLDRPTYAKRMLRCSILRRRQQLHPPHRYYYIGIPQINDILGTWFSLVLVP